MCGIIGYCDFRKKSSKEILVSMVDILDYRGPDDSGYEFFETKHAQIGLGHRRLSILDLSMQGHQPMSTEDGNLTIIYNGEVYNFAEIQKELEKDGFTFRSSSDTEVILKAFIRWGVDAVHKFIGMFAFVIFDKPNQTLYMFRDRVGVKPLYYFWKNELLLFASELKSFHQHPHFVKELDTDSLSLFLLYNYIPAPYSIFKDTFKLKPGHFLKVDIGSQTIQEYKYWEPIDHFNKPKLDISEQEAVEETERLLKSAFEYRMVSDVPVGVFLSGGYDSSAVTALLQKDRTERIKTFTIGFYEDNFNEAPYAKEVADYLGTDHTEYYCTPKEAADIIPTLAEMYDEPFGDTSSIPTALVSQLARQQVKVALSADGGDETFGGYDKYDTTLKYFNSFSRFPVFLRALFSQAMGLVNPNRIPILNKTYNFPTRYEKIRHIMKTSSAASAMKHTIQYVTDKELQKLLCSGFNQRHTSFDDELALNSDNNQINRMLAIDYKTYLIDNVLVKLDRATMQVSLEGRDPLLDQRIIEFVARLPSTLKYHNGRKKILLKQVVHRHLPREIMERPKMGFTVPIVHWFRDELKEYFLEYLSFERLQREGIFSPQEIIPLRDSYLRGNPENVNKLWLLFMFEMWYERWMQ